MLIASSEIFIFSSPKPLISLIARFNMIFISCISNGLKTKTLQRDNRAELISNEGFSVVAPIKIILPFSTNGRKASCCA